ncbi:MAG: hypothetical protein ACFFAN_04060 [Promethearchaeota archaeon]
MNANDNLFPKIKKLIVKSVKEGAKKKELIREPSQSWFHYFNYSQDPLDSFNSEVSTNKNNKDLFIDRLSEIEVISNYFGIIDDIPDSMHIAIVGSYGSGKRTTMNLITHIISTELPEIKVEFYDYNGFDFKRSDEISEEKLKKLDNTPLDVRILSCDTITSPFFRKRLRKYKKNTRIIFSIWHIKDYMSNQGISINKEIFFRNYSKSDVIQIIKKRVAKYLILNEKSKSYYDNLVNSVIPKIAEISKGNLRVSFLLFKALHSEIRKKELDLIAPELLDRFSNKIDILRNQKITSKEHKILKYYLSEGLAHITSSLLVEGLEFDRTVAWRYLEKLKDKGIFRKTLGNPSLYEINQLYLSLYEEIVKNELIFKER